MASGSQVRPSRIRYVVLALTTMVAVLLYLDRICLSFAERYVKEDLGITDAQMALVLSSFFWTYALGQLPAGWLSDRYGARLMLGLYLAAWSVCTGLLGFAYGLVILVVLRLGCGLFEAGAYPAAAGVIGKWMPFHRRGLASGIVSVGGRLGGAAAPVLTAYLMVAFVPVSSSSLLEPEDLQNCLELFSDLPNKRWSEELTKIGIPGNPAAIRGALSGPMSNIKSYLAVRVLDHLPKDNALGQILGAFPNWSNADLASFARDLNKILSEADLLDGIDLSQLDLPDEALRLTQPSRQPLSQKEIERRNRLVLEAAFPGAIRKVYGAGWRPVMMVYGLAGLVVACIFWWFFRDSPRQHPECNVAEIALIEGEQQLDPKAFKAPLQFTWLLKSWGLWCSSMVQLLTNFGWVFLITWFPRYLKDAHDVPLVERGWMVSMPIFVGMGGMFWGGWLTDYMVGQMGPRWGRSAPLALSRFVVAAAFAACIFLETPWQATVVLSMVALGTDLGTPAIWAYSVDVGGKHVGSVLGWSNMFGNIGAALSPIILNMIIGPDMNYPRMFMVCASAFVLAGMLALFIDATKPVVPAERLAA
ncbi:MAG TPA: MFS transporter [Gemmataceae bacterium]|jgi:ACS family glucarate transporter-like MFS transporter|nr:MFS transporter [Gemmataceae bacterium]